MIIGSRKGLNVLEVGSKTSTNATLFGRRVDADEDEVCFLDSFVDISRKEEVASTALADDILEARLVNGKVEILAIPGVDTALVEIDNVHDDIGTLQCNNSTSRST